MAALLPKDVERSDKAPLWGPDVATGDASTLYPSTPVVQGIVVGTSSRVDPVPLIDMQTAQVIGMANSFTIRQRPSVSEAFFAVCERSNIYDIFDAAGNPLFFAKERSGVCTRVCCAPQHSLFVEFKLAANINPVFVQTVDIDTLPAVMTMEREGCPGKPCLGCCAFTEACKDGMYLHAGAISPDADVAKLKQDYPGCIGYATQPTLAGGLTPTLNVMERGAQGAGAWNAMAKVEGPMCFGGWAECCWSSTFKVRAARFLSCSSMHPCRR